MSVIWSSRFIGRRLQRQNLLLLPPCLSQLCPANQSLPHIQMVTQAPLTVHLCLNHRINEPPLFCLMMTLQIKTHPRRGGGPKRKHKRQNRRVCTINDRDSLVLINPKTHPAMMWTTRACITMSTCSPLSIWTIMTFRKH
jgi:hypothetical protein